MSKLTSYKIADLCELKKGTSPTMKTVPGEYPLVVTAEFRRSSESYQFDTEAICVPLISSTGHGNAALHRVHYQSGKFALANLLVALIPRDRSVCLPKYLYYLLQTKKDQLLVPLMKGTANVSMKMQDVASVEVQIPPLNKQKEVVEKIDLLFSKLVMVNELYSSIENDTQSLLHCVFQKTIEGADLRPMAEIAPIIKRPVSIDIDSEYAEYGVRSFHKGIFDKCNSLGFDIAHKKMFYVETGDLVFSNIMAWEGAIGVAQVEDHQKIGVHRFITCTPIESVSVASFINFYFQTPLGFEKIVGASPATVARNRTLNTKKLESIEVPMPSYEKQLQFHELQKKVAIIQNAQAENQVKLDALLPSILDKAFKRML